MSLADKQECDCSASVVDLVANRLRIVMIDGRTYEHRPRGRRAAVASREGRRAQLEEIVGVETE